MAIRFQYLANDAGRLLEFRVLPAGKLFGIRDGKGWALFKEKEQEQDKRSDLSLTARRI